MAISRAQLLKELLPGLNALFGMEYARYGEEHKEIYETETSERSFEEETKLSGFSAAPVKNEGSAIAYDNAQEAWTARYNHQTIALGFSVTEEAIEDNLYDSLSARYTKALARAMAYTKQVKAAAVLNNAFQSSGYNGGDGVSLCNSSHPLVSGGTNANTPATQVDLNETSLEAAVIQISLWTDERNLLIAAKPRKLIVPPQLMFVAIISFVLYVLFLYVQLVRHRNDFIADHEVESGAQRPSARVALAALAVLMELVTRANASTDPAEHGRLKAELLAGGRELGILQQDPDTWFSTAASQTIDVPRVEELIAARNAARQSRDFAGGTVVPVMSRR